MGMLLRRHDRNDPTKAKDIKPEQQVEPKVEKPTNKKKK